MSFPTLETARLIVRPFTMADLDPLHQILDVELKWAGREISVAERGYEHLGGIATGVYHSHERKKTARGDHDGTFDTRLRDRAAGVPDRAGH